MAERAPFPGRNDVRPRILLLGATGLLGGELVDVLEGVAHVARPGRDALDLARPDDLRAAIRDLSPDAVVNAAAYTDVDGAERHRATAFALNAEAPRVLAEEAARAGALLVHFSTDYVFDGTSDRAYRESDPANPLNVYGESKLAGERAIQAVGAPHLILRTSWLYGTRRRSFFGTMRSLALERRRIEVVDDQTGSPTWSRAVARATWAMLRGGWTGADFVLDSGSEGLHHITAAGSTTWWGFAKTILEGAPDRSEHRCEELVPISSAERAALAARPALSVLDNTRIGETHGVRLATWRAQLAEVLAITAEDFSRGAARRSH